MENWTHKVKKGDILVSRYEYNSVHYNFYIVTKVSEKSIWMLELQKKHLGRMNNYGETLVTAVNKPAHDAQVIRKLKNGSMMIGYAYLRGIWDGKPLTEMSD